MRQVDCVYDALGQVDCVYDALEHADGDPEAQPLALALPLNDAVLQLLPEIVRIGEALLVTDGEQDSDAVGQCDAEAECDEVLLVLAQEDLVASALLLRLAGAESEGEGSVEPVLRPDLEPLPLGDKSGDKEAVGRGEALSRPDFEPWLLKEGERLSRPDKEPLPLAEGDGESEKEGAAEAVPLGATVWRAVRSPLNVRSGDPVSEADGTLDGELLALRLAQPLALVVEEPPMPLGEGAPLPLALEEALPLALGQAVALGLAVALFVPVEEAVEDIVAITDVVAVGVAKDVVEPVGNAVAVAV